MIEVTFTGETLEDVAKQAANFSSVALGGAKVGVKGSTKTAVKTAVAEPENDTAVADTAAAPDTKAMEKTREAALDKLRTMYSSGKEGQAAVKKISKDFGVKKLGDVPVEKADELMAAVLAAEVAPV